MPHPRRPVSKVPSGMWPLTSTTSFVPGDGGRCECAQTRVNVCQGATVSEKRPESTTEKAHAGNPTHVKLGRKKYEKELAKLQGELGAAQGWWKASGAKICIVFEGGHTARTGG